MVQDTDQVLNIQGNINTAIYSASSNAKTGLPKPWSLACVFTGAFSEDGPTLLNIKYIFVFSLFIVVIRFLLLLNYFSLDEFPERAKGLTNTLCKHDIGVPIQVNKVVLRRNPTENRAISGFTGQKSGTRIVLSILQSLLRTTQ